MLYLVHSFQEKEPAPPFSLPLCAGGNPGTSVVDRAVIFNMRWTMCDKYVRARRCKEPGSLMIVQSHTRLGPFVFLLYEREINFYLIYVTIILNFSVTSGKLIAYEI